MELIRQIRNLLYIDGFTISGARNKLDNESGVSAVTSIVAGEERKDTIRQLIKELDEVIDLLKT